MVAIKIKKKMIAQGVLGNTLFGGEYWSADLECVENLF